MLQVLKLTSTSEEINISLLGMFNFFVCMLACLPLPWNLQINHLTFTTEIYMQFFIGHQMEQLVNMTPLPGLVSAKSPSYLPPLLKVKIRLSITINKWLSSVCNTMTCLEMYCIWFILFKTAFKCFFPPLSLMLKLST